MSSVTGKMDGIADRRFLETANDLVASETVLGEEMSERDRNVQLRAELMESSFRHESEQAQKLIDDFLVKAREFSLPAVPLVARTLDGHTVKTDVVGWYLRNDHSIAIGTDGQYYQLVVPGGLATRLRGAKLEPGRPMLVVGRGGREGETGSLKEFLARALRGEVS